MEDSKFSAVMKTNDEVDFPESNEHGEADLVSWQLETWSV